MKKIIALLLSIVVLISVTACGANPTKNTTSDKKLTESTTTTDNTSEKLEVDENLLTVDITLPASFFQDQSEEEIKEKALENGCKKCTINDDGTVIYTMTKKAHKDLLKKMSDEIKKSVSELLKGENSVASFVSIDYNDDFSKYEVYVDPAKYNSMDSLYALGFYVTGAYYQALAGIDNDKIDVVVSFMDNETKEVIDTASYKEYMENMSN